MNTRNVVGKQFRGLLLYLHNGPRDAPRDKQPEVLLAVGVRETSASEMLEDFNRRRRQNPSLGNAVWHTAISFNPADAARLDSAKMLEIAERWVEEMKLNKTQYVIIRHHDREDNQHVHIVANRVGNNGKTVADNWNFLEARRINQLLEKEFNLTPARGSSQPELQHPERIEGPDRARAEIRQAIGRAVHAGVTERGELQKILRAQGIESREFVTKAGVVAGISFEKDGHRFNGSEVARDYGLAGLEKLLVRNRELHQEQVRQEQMREAARLETMAALTQTRDSGLNSPAQFFYRLRTQPYDLISDPQMHQLTHVRHRESQELFALAAVLPGGPEAPPLADQLKIAVELEQRQVTTRQQEEAARSWAQGRAHIETVIAHVQEAPLLSSRAELTERLQLDGITLLPPPALGQVELFRLEVTGQLYREKEVLRQGTVADLLADADARRAARREAAWEQTCEAVAQTLLAPKTPLTSYEDYQQQVETRGCAFRQEPGNVLKIEHLETGERFAVKEVQLGGLTAPALATQVGAVVADQQQGQAQALQQLEQVLAAGNFTNRAEYNEQVRKQGYQEVTGLDGTARLLHVESHRHFPRVDLQPNGRDEDTQVTEVIAAHQAERMRPPIEAMPTPVVQPVVQLPERIQGQIEVFASLALTAAQRANNVQAALVEAGALVTLTNPPAIGAAGSIILTYTHPLHGAQLDEVNAVLVKVQDSKGMTVREHIPGLGHSPAEWPVRSGEYAQATVAFADSAAIQAAAPNGSVTVLLQQTGAVAREVPSASARAVELEVAYHTQRADVKTLTVLLDKWTHEEPAIEVRETDRCRVARGGKSPAPEKGVEYGD
ncbi:relaxase/mobilization nuclease domain-containing protein [Hymenobacter artigasi]|uniref:MobA/VirD2-like nuclease domain-containing protein n=1 Tax=Hymenobacter artigasi TaxID=2719616 RepID=A0ABX1HM78_9BACT|nr:relaxase/mobilization nuclease domain-containing protein [Hymenobacter artigasi]NKI91363.1 hypothetical protein [Hymenobacter artigasi]